MNTISHRTPHHKRHRYNLNTILYFFSLLTTELSSLNGGWQNLRLSNFQELELYLTIILTQRLRNLNHGQKEFPNLSWTQINPYRYCYIISSITISILFYVFHDIIRIWSIFISNDIITNLGKQKFVYFILVPRYKVLILILGGEDSTILPLSVWSVFLLNNWTGLHKFQLNLSLN